MSILKSGTLCITVGPSGMNDGCVVRVIGYGWKHRNIMEGYRIETVSGRPFKAISKFVNGYWIICRNTALICIAD